MTKKIVLMTDKIFQVTAHPSETTAPKAEVLELPLTVNRHLCETLYFLFVLGHISL